RHAGTHQLDADHTVLGVDAAQVDVAVVGLDGRPDDLDDLLDLLPIDHVVPSWIPRGGSWGGFLVWGEPAWSRNSHQSGNQPRWPTVPPDAPLRPVVRH